MEIMCGECCIDCCGYCLWILRRRLFVEIVVEVECVKIVVEIENGDCFRDCLIVWILL